MVISGWQINLNIWARWLHVLAGIVWIGHLYVLDFVYSPLRRSLDQSNDSSVLSKFMLRGLWWFRWGAMITFLSGLFLFFINYLYIQGKGFGATALFVDDQGITERATWILFGMVTATIMWFNTWFVIWPGQKRLLIPSNPPNEHDFYLVRRSFLAIRTNTILSGPMLFAMVAPSHYGSIDFRTWILVLVIGGFFMAGLVMLARYLGTVSK